MRRLIIALLVAFMVTAPVFAVSGFSVTLGEATDSNPSYRNAVMDYSSQRPIRISIAQI